MGVLLKVSPLRRPPGRARPRQPGVQHWKQGAEGSRGTHVCCWGAALGEPRTSLPWPDAPCTELPTRGTRLSRLQVERGESRCLGPSRGIWGLFGPRLWRGRLRGRALRFAS